MTACKGSYQKRITDIHVENYAPRLSGQTTVFVIPGTGCTGCITKAEQFFTENCMKDEYLFIFTNIVSVKNLKIKIGDQRLLQRDNVILDVENTLYIAGFEENIYPFKYEFKDGKLVKCQQL